MNNLSDILRRVLNNKHDFCCLCFKTIDEHPIHFEDDVVIYRNNISVADVLSCVLGDEICKAMSLFEVICTDCVSVAATSYSFIAAARGNARRLTDLLDQLHNGFQHTPSSVEDSKALFVSLPPDRSSHLYYTNKRVKSTRSALSKLKEITKSIDPDFETNENTDDIVTTIKEPIVKNDKITRKGLTQKILKSIYKSQDKNDYKVVKCKHCLKVYTGSNNLKSHYVRVHAPKVHKCTVCDKGFGSSSLLELHREESHASLVCGECGLTFRNRHRLRIHERTHTVDSVRFSCPECGRVFKDSDACKQHITFDLCNKEKRATFTCDYCQKSYAQKLSLKVHIEHKHLGTSGSYCCKLCPKKYPYKCGLKAHARTHSGRKEFICDICDEGFASKHSLAYHSRTHAGERTFRCGGCGARFLSAASRAAHRASLAHPMTEECDICHSRFPSRTFLERHRKLHLDILAGIGFRLRTDPAKT